MLKLFLYYLFLMLISQSFVCSSTLKCKYHSSYYMIIEEDGYVCNANHDGNRNIFNGRRVTVDSVEGEHKTPHTNANVNGFTIDYSSLNFFPNNLNKFFANLITIHIYSCNLQEIKQNDIKVFPKLKYINLGANEITAIDQNLFEFNPELKAILLNDNKISHIDLNVFDHLSNLETLYVSGNMCKGDLGDVFHSTSEVSKLLQQIRNGECFDEQANVLINKQIQKKLLESEKMNMTIADLTRKLNEQRVQSDNNLDKLESKIKQLKATIKDLSNEQNEMEEKMAPNCGNSNNSFMLMFKILIISIIIVISV